MNSPENQLESADGDAEIQALIARAQAGDQRALGELLDRHRAYLKLLARRHVDGRLAKRVDASDLVQKTCLSVVKNFGKFNGKGGNEFVAWLCKVHQQNIQNEIRDHAVAKKRAIGKEQHVSEGVARDVLAADQSSPSQRLMNDERAVELARLLERLPPDQSEAVRLRHLEGWPLAQIAARMERSESATVGLIKRGMKKLREYLHGEP